MALVSGAHKDLDAGHSLSGRANGVKKDGDDIGDEGAWVLAVVGVVLHEAAHIGEIEEMVVDGHGNYVGVVLEGGVADAAANVAKPFAPFFTVVVETMGWKNMEGC